jgi:foldase protein PrsA
MPALALLGALLATLALTACGDSSQKPTQASKAGKSAPASTSATSTTPTTTEAATTTSAPPPNPAAPQTVVASVAGQPIRFAEISHLITMKSGKEPPPDPPAYSACIARRKAAPPAKPGAALESEEELKEGCQKSYAHLLQTAVSAAIHNRWLSGEARELGISVSPSSVQRELAEGRKSFKSEAEFKAYLKGAHETLADASAELKINKLADAIFKKIKAKEHPASSAEVAAFYNAHRKRFSVPVGREVRIFRTTTKASAERSLQQIKQGKSFAQVAKELSAIGQPIGASEGEVKDLLPGVFEEKPLNDAIFNSKPHRLYGPMEVTAGHPTIAPETNSGFFVWEVLRSVPGRQTPLGQVRNAIAEELTKSNKEKTLSGFIAAFRAKWSARTDCKAGYVVLNCRQYRKVPGEVEDPFTL